MQSFWYRLGKWILNNRPALLAGLFVSTAFMVWQASQVKLSYEFSKAIPTDNIHYRDYQAFKAQFGEEGNVLVMGVSDPLFFEKARFDAYIAFINRIRAIRGVQSVLSVASAVNLVRSDSSERLVAKPVFADAVTSQSQLDSAAALFQGLPFYRGLLHNPISKAYLAGATISSSVLASKDRTRVVNEIKAASESYSKATGSQVHLSGLPFIRTQIADRIKSEMNYFLLGSLLLAAITLILFFRSGSATILSLLVVMMGVAWAFGTMHLLGYKITLLNALIPPLIIVIGIPNCIYFLNKYHMSWVEGQQQLPPSATGDLSNSIKKNAIVTMVGRMGVVTLFCNIAAAVGFAVFGLTESALLKEFGVVAGINIMVIFLISLVFIPIALSYLPPPFERHTRYLRNRFLENTLVRIEYFVMRRKRLVYTTTLVVVAFSIAGIFRLKSVGYIVDDLPKSDVIYTDLKWFEKHFGGVMPLEVLVDAGKDGAITRNLATIEKINVFSDYLQAQPGCARPLSLVEGLKFVKQAYYDGDTLSYAVPNEFDMAFLGPYLRTRRSGSDSTNQLANLIRNFLDSNRRVARISVNMADVGTLQLEKMLTAFKSKADTVFNYRADGEESGSARFDSTYHIQFTGSSVTYLEGSRFIINGLKESIFWAFILIAGAMLYLFRSFRILVCSLVPNIIPLLATAGIMGWAEVPLKPSTVLVFSVALGIAIDITIRFLVNYKQELPNNRYHVLATTTSTIRQTGISIIYTSLVLVAGFVIFMFSSFGGTYALGWLTSLTLLVATVTNLVLLPVIMLGLLRDKPDG